MDRPLLDSGGGVLDTSLPSIDARPMDTGRMVDTSLPDAGRWESGLPVDGGAPQDARADTMPMDGATVDASMDAGADSGTGNPACATALMSARFDFEGGSSGWSHDPMDGVTSPTWPLDPWEHGTPTQGPSSCGEGSACFGTDMAANYAQCGRAELRSPSIDLSSCSGETVVLRWEHWYSFWTGFYDGQDWFDGGLVEVSSNGGSTWTALPDSIFSGQIRINPNRGFGYACLRPDSFYVHTQRGFVGDSDGWETVEVELDAGLLTSNFRIRLAWASGVSSATTNATISRLETAPGWYIDHVRIEAR